MRRRFARGCRTWPASAGASATAGSASCWRGKGHDEPQEVRRQRRRKLATGTRAPITRPQAANQRSSLDFAADVLSWGRRLRVLAIVDDFTREALALAVDTSIGGRRVVRELDALITRRARPTMIASDNGTELTSRAVLAWTNRTGTRWHYIAPGKPTQNACVESFIGRSVTSA